MLGNKLAVMKLCTIVEWNEISSAYDMLKRFIVPFAFSLKVLYFVTTLQHDRWTGIIFIGAMEDNVGQIEGFKPASAVTLTHCEAPMDDFGLI